MVCTSPRCTLPRPAPQGRLRRVPPPPAASGCTGKSGWWRRWPWWRPEVDVTGFYDVIHRRRDVRGEFTGAPVPTEVLDRILGAAHTAPNVGLSRPCDFVLIRDRTPGPRSAITSRPNARSSQASSWRDSVSAGSASTGNSSSGTCSTSPPSSGRWPGCAWAQSPPCRPPPTWNGTAGDTAPHWPRSCTRNGRGDWSVADRCGWSPLRGRG